MWCVTTSEADVVNGWLLPLAVSNKLMLPESRTNHFFHKKRETCSSGPIIFYSGTSDVGGFLYIQRWQWNSSSPNINLLQKQQLRPQRGPSMGEAAYTSQTVMWVTRLLYQQLFERVYSCSDWLFIESGKNRPQVSMQPWLATTWDRTESLVGLMEPMSDIVVLLTVFQLFSRWNTEHFSQCGFLLNIE